ncbi:MAG TPA: hypothetical protein VFR02_05375 [bacterium]|nr:hypothetical protein [bacterium]
MSDDTFTRRLDYYAALPRTAPLACRRLAFRAVCQALADTAEGLAEAPATGRTNRDQARRVVRKARLMARL